MPFIKPKPHNAKPSLYKVKVTLSQSKKAGEDV